MKIFNSVVRVKILALLYGLEYCEFNYLKDKLNLTEGNLMHHLKKLEDVKYIEMEKIFVEGRVKTIIKITTKGREEFKNYIYEILNLSKTNFAMQR